MKKIVRIVIIVVCAAILAGVGFFSSSRSPKASSPSVPTLSNGYSIHTFTDAQGHSLHYYLYVPDQSDPAKKYPLVLLLHGGGERINPTKSASWNLTNIMKQAYVQVWTPGYNAPGSPHVQQNWPCFVVVPQIALGQQWVNTPVRKGSYTMTPQPATTLLLAKELVDTLQAQYNDVDANRLYVTGISLGGYGTWDAIERWPNYFAAAAPLSGAGDPSRAAVLKNMPIWAFHSTNDTTIPVSGSRDMIAAIKKAGGNPRYTEFPGSLHEVWDYAYSLHTSPLRVPDFFPWLFSQHR